MISHVKSYAAHSLTGRLGPLEFDRRSPRSDDVVIEILYCGVCHSDVHNVRNDWGNALYPMVPGHEIIGRVVEVGPCSAVKRTNEFSGCGSRMQNLLMHGGKMTSGRFAT
jgi:D-arabinose 1-dehydrogenase-like Zn-dependent alcohol dehydrogenase